MRHHTALAVLLTFPLVVACGPAPLEESPATIDEDRPSGSGAEQFFDTNDVGDNPAPDAGTLVDPADAGAVGIPPDAGLIVIDAGSTANDAGVVDASVADSGPVIDDGPLGFIGSPCTSNTDCAFAQGRCDVDASSRGVCVQDCDKYCPDQTGHPVTFCVAESDLPQSLLPIDDDGLCLSRCDFDFFPETGCRPDYGCKKSHRANEPGTTQFACLPGVQPDPIDCLSALGILGVDFTPVTMADEHPSTHPGLTCHVEQPVRLHPPIHGVNFVYEDNTPSPNILAACNMALALVQTVDDLIVRGVETIHHLGSYNCRVIDGTNTLSRHGFGDAIDLSGFDLDNGNSYTLLNDWQYNTTAPTTPGGVFLYNASKAWHEQIIWTVILTPNFNSAHADHFHADLTPFMYTLENVQLPVLDVSPHND